MRKNRRKGVRQAPKTGRSRTAAFWHSMSEGLDFADEVMLNRVFR